MSLTGGPRLSTVPFKNLNSFNFDGVDDYINTNSIYSELNGQSKITISAWIKVGSGTDSSSYLCSTSGGSFVQFAIRLQTGTNTTCWVYVDNAGNNNRQSTNLGAIKNDGQWHHLLVCLDLSLPNTTECQIFLDNTPKTMSGYYANTTLPSSTSELHIATRSNGLTDVYGGNIDEFAIWSGTDLRNDVSTIYNGGVPNNLNDNGLTSPTSWYRMGDNATWNGQTWIIPNSGTDTQIVRSINMLEANRTTDVPPNPFTNTLSTIFDGVDDYVDCGNPSSLQITNTITLSAWVKMSSTSGQSQDCIISKDNTSQRSYTIWGKTSFSSSPIAYIWNGGTNYSVQATTNIEDDNWHHVMLVYVPSTSLNIYIDGVLEGSNTTSIPSSINNAIQNFHIGQFGNGTFELNGNIDEVAVWNSDQSANAFTIYNGGVPNDITSLSPLSWWRMGDGSTYPTINDEIGSNDGTMTNMSSANFVNDVPEFNTKSILLDGVDDRIECSSLTAYDNSDFSVSIWVKKTTSGLEYVISNSSATSKAGFDIIINSLNVNFSRRTRTKQATTGYINIGFSYNTWNNLVGTYNDTTGDLKLYLNGVLKNTSATSVDVNTASADLRIGCSTSNSLFFQGGIDEVSLFNTELSQSDITTIYNSGTPNNIASLSPLSWWRCGDGDTAPTLTDNGSGGNDGTMTNFTTFSTDVPN